MKNASLYIDLAFCLGFLPLMIFAFPVERWWGTYPVFFCSFVGWLYATYFSYKYFIVPRLFHKGRPRMYALTAIAVSLLVTFLFSSYEISSPFYHVRQQLAAIPVPSWGARQNQQAIWLHYIIVVIFCFAVGMLTEAYRQRLAREEVEYERNKAELALYKAQINPHFLFNTLNALYGLLITRSDKTEATLERFINLTKYIATQMGKKNIRCNAVAPGLVLTPAALDNLNEDVRLNGFAEVRFDRTVEHDAMSVPPMLLITFVENAFKYGISSNEPCFVRIRLRQQGSTLRFEVENSVFGRESQNSKRMGIANCRKRLALLYPDRHRLETGTDADGLFRVRLEIQSPAL